MLSWTERNRRRGAITRNEFLSRVALAGFVEVPSRPGFMHEFTHPDTGARHYCVRAAQGGYARSLASMQDELQAGRVYMGAAQ